MDTRNNDDAEARDRAVLEQWLDDDGDEDAPALTFASDDWDDAEDDTAWPVRVWRWVVRVVRRGR